MHAIAYADRNELQGDVMKTTREGYNLAQDISAYSLIAVARYGQKILNHPGSIVTLTYMGSVRAIPNYNALELRRQPLNRLVRYLARDMGKG